MPEASLWLLAPCRNIGRKEFDFIDALIFKPECGAPVSYTCNARALVIVRPTGELRVLGGGGGFLLPAGTGEADLLILGLGAVG